MPGSLFLLTPRVRRLDWSVSYMKVFKIPARNIREGDRIYMHYTFPQVRSVEAIEQSTGDVQMKIELETDDNKQLVRFYDYNRMVIIRR